MKTLPTTLDDLELELRRLPGIVGVGFSEEDGVVIVHVQATVPHGLSALRRQIVQRARAFVDRTLVIDLQEFVSSAVASDRGRVKLVDVRVQEFTQEMEVHLAHSGVHTVGRALAGSPEDAVDATLQALSDLGADLPFRKIEAASASVEGAQHQAVIVILEPENDPHGTRYGVARGDTMEEAAARATLHALNRYLSRGAPLSSAT